jgi:dihydrofolate reductase/thymidylate synthase
MEIYNHPEVNLIIAVDQKWGISKEGKIPWKIMEDINFFQDVTKREYVRGKMNVVIMGKNTWLSLPKKGSDINHLEGRINIVVSTTLEDISNDKLVYFAKSLSEAIKLCENLRFGKIFVCGGSRIYEETVKTSVVDRIYISVIDKDYGCDNFFYIYTDIRLFDTVSTLHFSAKDLNADETVNLSIDVFEKSKDNIFEPCTNKEESKYLSLMENIIKNGQFKSTRNSMVWSKFGEHLKFDLSKGFPLLTTKKIFFKGVVEELLFFLKGDTNANHLNEKGVKIWNANTTREFLDSVGLKHYEVGDMGPMYGFNWVHFGAYYQGMNHNYIGQGFNQIKYCLDLLKKDPHSRRIMMTTYNPAVAKEGCLYPCHGIDVIFNVDVDVSANKNNLSCMMTQRSADLFLGIPFNIASYGLLVYIFCEVINNDETYKGRKFTPGVLTINLGDVHVYEGHYTQCIRQILREPYSFPQLKINKTIKSVTDFSYEDLELVDYISYPPIQAKMYE